VSWATAAIGEIFEVARGGSPRPIEDYLTDDPEGLNWVLIGDATASGKTITETKKRIRREGLSKTRAVKPGDFILSNSMSFGRPYIMGINGCIHDGWLLLRPKSDRIFPDYFYHLLGSSEVYQRFASRAAGATVKNLNSEIVREVEVSFPPLDEQRRIAEILDQADDLRRKRVKALERLQRLDQAIFIDLTASLNDCSKTLGDIIRVRSGEFLPQQSQASAGQYPVFGGNGISGFHDQYIVEPSTIIVGRVGVYCGVIHIAKQRAWVTDNALIVDIKEPNVLPVYLAAAMKHADLNQYAGRSAQPLVSGGRIYPVRVPVPPTAIQQTFAEHVTEIDKLRAHHRAHLAKLDALFGSLQHRAFRGEL
jgi:type I restriction enzyme S subunit